MIVSQINHGKANDSKNGYPRKIPYDTDNIASLPTEENHISIHTACSTTIRKTVNQKTTLIGSRQQETIKTFATIGNDEIMH